MWWWALFVVVGAGHRLQGSGRWIVRFHVGGFTMHVWVCPERVVDKKSCTRIQQYVICGKKSLEETADNTGLSAPRFSFPVSSYESERL